MPNKVVINLATGLEDAERVMIALLVGTAAVDGGKQVAMFLTKDAVRLGVPGEAAGCLGIRRPVVPRTAVPEITVPGITVPGATVLGITVPGITDH